MAGQLCTVAANNSNICGVGDIFATNQVNTISASGSLNCNYLITVCSFQWKFLSCSLCVTCLLQAPIGTKIYFQLTRATFTRSSPCSASYLEINYRSDFTRSGARFCTSYPTISLSESNQLLIIYKGVNGAAFSLNYRYDPVTFSTNAPITIPTQTTSAYSQSTTEPTVATSTTVRVVTTTAQSTTVPFPTTTSNSQCSEWSNCSAQCGGCGTKSRK